MDRIIADIDELDELFSGWNYEDVKIEGRKDLYAFNLLGKLLPGDCDIIASAEHDIIYLDPDWKDLVGVITERQVKELVMCGVFIEDEEHLAMFV